MENIRGQPLNQLICDRPSSSVKVSDHLKKAKKEVIIIETTYELQEINSKFHDFNIIQIAVRQPLQKQPIRLNNVFSEFND